MKLLLIVLQIADKYVNYLFSLPYLVSFLGVAGSCSTQGYKPHEEKWVCPQLSETKTL